MKRNVFLIMVGLSTCLLFFQNCGGYDAANTAVESSVLLPSSTPSSAPVVGNVLGGGFNKIAPQLTKDAANQVFLSGLSGNHSGTKNVKFTITASAGSGEEFQEMLLRCEVTGASDVDLRCNNRNFSDGKVEVEVRPRRNKECVSGTASVKYWVEDSDPNDDSVPVLKSAEKTFSVSIKNNCYNEKKLYPKERGGQDNFGATVKLTSKYLFASSPGDDSAAKNAGAIQVFLKSGSNWLHSQTLKVSQPEADIKISAMDAAGDHLVVGSPFSAGEVGRVFTFTASNNQFSESLVLKSDSLSPLGTDHFGHSVATDGQWLAIGAPNDSTGNVVARGAIYLYKLNGGTWSFVKKILGEKAYEELGYSLSMDGGYLAAGAPENFAGQLGKGLVYIFKNDGTPMGSLTDAKDVTATSIFGGSVALSGTTLVVGAQKAKGRRDDSGAAYVYKLEGGAWKPVAKLQGSDGDKEHEFGRSVDISGSHIVIGARRESDDKYRKGSAYHFKGSGNTWKQNYKIMSRDRAERDYFGTSVSVNGSTAVIGASLDDGEKDKFMDGLGALYIYGLK